MQWLVLGSVLGLWYCLRELNRTEWSNGWLWGAVALLVALPLSAIYYVTRVRRSGHGWYHIQVKGPQPLRTRFVTMAHFSLFMTTWMTAFDYFNRGVFEWWSAEKYLFIYAPLGFLLFYFQPNLRRYEPTWNWKWLDRKVPFT